MLKYRKVYYTYVLKSQKDNKTYIGWTPDIKKRIQKHNLGLVLATKSRRPLELIFYEGFVNKKDAFLREKFLKSGWGRRHLQKTLKYTLGGNGSNFLKKGPPA